MLSFAIVHYNTPQLTDALIKSIRKFHPDARITVMDNSDRIPLCRSTPSIVYLDNTDGQLVDFQAELEKYPQREIGDQQAFGSNFGSAKHAMSVQYLLDTETDPFILLDSDTLLRAPVDDIVDDSVCCVSSIDYACTARVFPVIAYMNTPRIRSMGIRFYDGNRMHGLKHFGIDGSMYDTGASFYEDLRPIGMHRELPNYRIYVLHFGHGSWPSLPYNPMERFERSYLPPGQWLEENRELWWSGE